MWGEKLPVPGQTTPPARILRVAVSAAVTKSFPISES